MSILKNEMQEGKLASDVVLMVENNLTACWKSANHLEIDSIAN
jgi:hypothetical protein